MVWNEGSGYCISPAGGVVGEAGAVVVLGGLAMAKFGCPVEDVQRFIARVSGAATKVVGVGFMDIFRRMGWHTSIDFDSLLNATLETEKLI